MSLKSQGSNKWGHLTWPIREALPLPAGVVCKETAKFTVWASGLLGQPHGDFLPFHLHKPDLRFFSEASSEFWGSPHQRAATHSKSSYRLGWRAWQLVLCRTVWHKELMLFQETAYATSFFWKIIEDMLSKQSNKNWKYKEKLFIIFFFKHCFMAYWGVFFTVNWTGEIKAVVWFPLH